MSISPNHPMTRGIQAARAGQAADAVRWFRQAVDAAPSDSTALAWLGQAMCATGARLEGTAHLRSAGDAMLENELPAKLTHLVQIIQQLQQWSDVAGALDLVERAAAMLPAEARLQQILAVCLGQLNKPADALAACTRAQALGPPDLMLIILQASLLADKRDTAQAQALLKSLLAQDLPPLHRFRAHKELARVEDALGNHDDAFAALEAASTAARLLPDLKRFDRGFMPAQIAANRQAFAGPILQLNKGKTAASALQTHLFILGFYRSGTTLLQAVLDAHPDIFVADEAGLVSDMQKNLTRLRPAASSLTEKYASLAPGELQHLRDQYWAHARGRFGAGADAKVFVDKFALNTIDIGLINLVFPDAKVIFMLRDPRDVCLSCYMQLMAPTHATVHLLDWSSTAVFYAQVMDWWQYIRPRLTLTWLELRYEDLVTDFESHVRGILEMLGLPWDERLREFDKKARGKFIASPSRNQVAQPLYDTSLARWRHYERHFVAIESVLAPLIQTFGYPTR
jgi:Flp pilus assembly protein TadD